MRKIGKLNGIPIVEGDPNLLKSNEILHKGRGQLSKRNNTGKIEDLGNSDSGEGGGSGGGSNIEYLDVSGMDDTKKFTFIGFASLCKIPQEKKITIENRTLTINKGISYSAEIYLPLTINDRTTSSPLFVGYMSAISAIAIDFSTRIILPGYSFDGTTEEYISLAGGAEFLKTIPRLTKEEFYNLED